MRYRSWIHYTLSLMRGPCGVCERGLKGSNGSAVQHCPLWISWRIAVLFECPPQGSVNPHRLKRGAQCCFTHLLTSGVSPPPPHPFLGALHVSGPRHNMRWILCAVAGEDLRGRFSVLSVGVIQAELYKARSSKTVLHLCRNWIWARTLQEPPSWQPAALHQSSSHPSLVNAHTSF